MKLSTFILLALIFNISHAQIGSKIQSSSAGYLGEWTNSEFGYEMKLLLNSGGKGSFDGETLSYIQTGNTLTVNLSGQTTNYTYQLTDNNTLILTGGDLQAPVKFTRKDTGNALQAPQSSSANQLLTGSWTGAGEELEFKSDGTMMYNGNLLSYSGTDKSFIVTTQAGEVNFQYTINNDQLMLTSNGQSFIYTRKAVSGNQVNTQPTQPGNTGGQGVIAAEMVGKWCYVNVTSSNTGGSSTEECFTLFENGTYEYNSESSRSATGYNSYGNQTFTGGTSGQSSDRGSWRVQGNNIIVNSQTQGQIIYPFTKQNHPKTGDPMIVLNGRTFVTYYQKPPWK